jgi:hypothetical protein
MEDERLVTEHLTSGYTSRIELAGATFELEDMFNLYS